MQQADRGERCLLGNVEAGRAALVSLHAAGPVEHECERDLWRLAWHAARERRHPFERRLIVATGAKTVFAAEDQEAAAVISDRLLDQILLESDQIDGRHIHQ